MALGGKLGLVFIAWDDTRIDIHHPWNSALTWRRKHPLSMFCLCQKTDWGPKETEPLKKKYQRNYKRVPKQHKRGKNHWKKKQNWPQRDQRSQNCPKRVKSSSLTIPISSGFPMPHWYEFHTEIYCKKSLRRIGLTHQLLPGCNLNLIANYMGHVIFDMAMCVPNVNTDHLDLEQRQKLLLFNPEEKSLQDSEKERSKIRIQLQNGPKWA